MKSKQKQIFFKPRSKVSRILNRFVYFVLRFYFRMLFMILFGARIHCNNRLLRQNSYILICNHQSLFDPVTMPMMSSGTFSFAATHTLFRNKIFSQLITFLGAVPIGRGATNNEAFKLLIDEFHDGSSINVFPEGTISLDGKLKKFKGGVEFLLRKTQAPIQVAVVSGNHKILPKYRKLSSLSTFPINTIFAEPIFADEYLQIGARGIGEFLENKTQELTNELQAKPIVKMHGITSISQIIVQLVNLYTTCIRKFVSIFK